MEIARTGHWSAEYRRNRTLLGGFQFEVEHGADEVGELGVSFGSSGNGIKRCLRIRLSATGRGLSCGIGRVGSWTVCATGELGDGGFEYYKCHII